MDAWSKRWRAKRLIPTQVVVEEETPANFWAAFTPDARALADEAARTDDAAAVRDLELKGQALRDRAAAASGYLKAYDIKPATAPAAAPAPKAPEVAATPAARETPGARGRRGEVVVLPAHVGRLGRRRSLPSLPTSPARPRWKTW